MDYILQEIALSIAGPIIITFLGSVCAVVAFFYKFLSNITRRLGDIERKTMSIDENITELQNKKTQLSEQTTAKFKEYDSVISSLKEDFRKQLDLQSTIYDQKLTEFRKEVREDIKDLSHKVDSGNSEILRILGEKL